MLEYLEIFFVLLSGYLIVIGSLSLNDGDFKYAGTLGVLLILLYFPVIASYASRLEWQLEDRALWELYKENIEWLMTGGVVGVLHTLVDDQYISNFFKNKKVSQISKPHKKTGIMGASSSNFDNKSLDIQSIAIIKLTHSAFGHLDRQVSASIEANLNIKPNQRRIVQRLLAEVIDQKPSLSETLRPLMSAGQGRHNMAYGVFDKVCIVAAHSQKYSLETLNNLISIAQHLGLSEDEIYYLFQKSRLAV